MTTLMELSTGSGRRRRRPTRMIVFGLDGDDWERLERMAAAELRVPELQARWIVLQALRALGEERPS